MRKILALVLLVVPVFFALAVDAQEPQLPPDRQSITPENAAQLEQVLVFEEPLAAYQRIDWSADGQWMVVTGLSRKTEFWSGIVLYDLGDLANYITLIDPAYSDTEAAFIPDGPFLAVSGSGEIEILDIEHGVVRKTITGDVLFGPFEWSPDGRMIAATPNLDARALGGASGDIAYVFDVRNGELIGTVGYPFSEDLFFGSMEYHFAPDGQALITILEYSSYLWNIHDLGSYRDPLLVSKSEYVAQLEYLQYTPHDAPRYAYTIFRNEAGQFALWLVTEDGVALFSTQDGAVTAVTPNVSGEGPYNDSGVPAAMDGYTQLSKPDVLKALSELQDMTFATTDAPVRMINPREAAEVAPRWVYDPQADTVLDQQTGRVYTAVENEQTGQFVADDGSPARDTPYYVGEWRVPEELTRFEGVSQLIFSPDGRTVAAIGPNYDGSPGIRLLDYETGEEIVPLENVPGDVSDTLRSFYSFHPSGQLLAAYINGQVFIWNIQTGQLVKTFQAGEDESHVSFSADGTLFVTGGSRLHFYGVVE